MWGWEWNPGPLQGQPVPHPLNHHQHQSPCSAHTQQGAVCKKCKMCCFKDRSHYIDQSVPHPPASASLVLRLQGSHPSSFAPVSTHITPSTPLIPSPIRNHVTTPFLIYKSISSLVRKHSLLSVESSSLPPSTTRASPTGQEQDLIHLCQAKVEQHLTDAGDPDFCHSLGTTLRTS